MKIGKTDFGKHVKRWSFKHFKDVFGVNNAVMCDLAAHNHTVESAFTLLTGKKAEMQKKPAKKKDV